MSEPAPPANPKRSDTVPKHHRRYTCLAYIMAVVCMLCLAIVIGARWFGYKALNELTPDQIAQLREAETRIVQLPDEWHRPADISPRSIIAFQADFAKEVLAISEDNGALLNPKIPFDPLLSGMIPPQPDYYYASEKDTWSSRALFTRFQYAVSAIDDDQRTSYDLMMARLEPVVDAATSATAQPGYTMVPEAVSAEFPSRLHVFARLMQMRSNVQLFDGDTTGAMQSAILPMKLIQHPEQTSALYHLIGSTVAVAVSESFCNVAMKTTDTQTLKNALELMDAHRTGIILVDEKDILPKELLSTIRNAAAYDLPVNIQPQTPAKIYRQYVWLQENYVPWAIENLPSSNPYYVSARKVSARRTSRTGFTSLHERLLQRFLERITRRDLPTDPDPISYGVTCQLLGFDLISFFIIRLDMSVGTTGSAGINGKLEELPIYITSAAAVYDLARLRLAQQLAIAEGKMDEATSPTASAQAVTSYINPMPLDPFTSAPFKVSPQGQFYSIGPDKTDDHAATPYDATNGTTSPGDIYFLPPKDPNEPDPIGSILPLVV